jgi:chromosome partitioning protein
MFVFSIVQQKGGVGKTTLAIHIAAELRARGKKVLVVDADPQASALAWASPRKLGYEVRGELVKDQNVSHWLRNVLKRQADFTIVDTPAGLGPVFRAAVDIADLVIVPCGPSSLDLNAARLTLSEVGSALRSDARSLARVVTVPTRVDVQQPEGQQLAEELSSLGESVAPPLSQDVYYVRAFAQGVAVTTAAPASPAAGEIRAVTDYLLGRLAEQGNG